MKLSEHFTLDEFTRTGAGLPNIPSDFERARLKRLAETLEQVRDALGAPIHITSGFRSEQVNRAVGGALHSAHLRGDAADFVCPGFGDPARICIAIIDAGIIFDQLILEPTWVHLGLSDAPRNQVMTFLSGRCVPGLKL